MLPMPCSGTWRQCCNAELFDNSLKDQVVINDATDSLAFLAVFGDIVAEKLEAVYLLSDLQRKYGSLPIGKYLDSGMLRKVFASRS
jgi:hypothetical protein